MDKKITDCIPLIVSLLGKEKIADTSAFLGFDACIDIIAKVVKNRSEEGQPGYFAGSGELGEFLISRQNNSCDIELQTRRFKPGGNMVIMANALGRLGVRVDCVGTFGFPEILPVFRSMSPNCNLHTIGETISATALEFDSSKVILFDPGPYNTLTWEGIRDLLGIEKIRSLCSGKKLISFLNWSEIEQSSAIWKGFLDDILPLLKPLAGQQYFFTDFSDCSRKARNEIRYAVELLGRFRNHFKVIVSLNQNEAALIANALDVSGDKSDQEFISSLFKLINTDILIIHRVKEALAYDGINLEQCDTFYCPEPVILTGGGDNFNSGFCYSMYYGLDLFQSLIVANAVSGIYVKSGISPDYESLKGFLEQI